MSYTRFFAMIVTATVVMFGLMYSTTYAMSHVWWSETRFWMALYMGATMTIIMLGFMLSMYEDRTRNIAIFVVSAIVLGGSLYFARSQSTIGDVGWMKAMIPHHSIAILTSERAEISDPRVRRLADEIILAQRREIAEMEAMIADLEGLDYESAPLSPSVRPVTGGSDDIDDTPIVRLADPALVGNVVMLEETRTRSDAWVVLHPAAEEGGPDMSIQVGRAFLLHGVNDNVPVGIRSDVSTTDSLYAVLHDDAGEIGVFESGVDRPVTTGGNAVAQALALR